MNLAKMMILLFSLIWFASPLLAQSSAPATAPAEEADEELTPEQTADIAEAIQPGLVIVEYNLRYDKGEEPYVAGWLPNANPSGQFLGELVEQERPLLVPGVLISATEVLTLDPMIHPRFLESTKVRFGEELLAAKPAKYAQKDQYAMILRLAAPFQTARPLAFDAQAEGPYFGVVMRMNNARWSQIIKPFSPEVITAERYKPFFLTPPACVFVSSDGAPVGVNANTHIFLDAEWKGSPGKLWSFLSAERLAEMLDTLKGRADKGVFRVTLGFRSPKKEQNRLAFQYDEAPVTEMQVVGLGVDPKTVLVLTNLHPKTTARLERVRVHVPGAKSVNASFTHTLKDYGAFVASLEKPLSGRVVLSAENILDYEDCLLPAVELRIQGEKRVAYYQHRRIGGYTLGWRSQVYPKLHGPEENLFLFDENGELIALPIAHRSKVRQDRHDESSPRLTAAMYLRDVLAKLEDNVDVSNVPLSEAEESRLAWLGLVLQPLNPELARVNKVSDLTRNGESGALISYVYPDSPAARAGLQPGDILLRLHVEGEPRPVEIEVERAGQSWFPMLWQKYDEIPEQLFDRIPRPWPPAENHFTRTLTDLGFGKKFTAEYFRGGKVHKENFTVTQSPPHYDTAEKYKSKPLGMTVRDLTYELRQYFRRPAGEPGVIISKVEPGSKASVAGLRPYEIITHVNDKPVMDVKEFKALTKSPGELRFEVKRWTRGRVAKTTLNAPAATQPASQPTTSPADPSASE
ncbi:MAG: PDZ domain-containing protein [Phycisphaerae bacterium]|nr:PDZ domain-containing protein [Phycisphaerae bacterium]